MREEIRQDKDWVIRLRSARGARNVLPDGTVASHDFQTALQNYLDLDDLRHRLDTWQRSFAAYEDLIERRRAYYEPLLPGLDQQFRELDSRRRVRLEQRKILTDRLQSMLIAPRPDLLATTDERLLVAGARQDRDADRGGRRRPERKPVARVGRLRGW